MTLKEALEELLENNDELYSVIGTVDSVDKNKRTCDISPLQDKDAVLYDVRLQADLEGSKGMLCFPTIGSVVAVTFINKDSGYVALFSEVDSVELVVGQQKMDFDKDGLLLESAQGSLLSAWKDLLSILKEFRLSTNSGLTIAVTPDILAKVELLDIKINSFLK